MAISLVVKDSSYYASSGLDVGELYLIGPQLLENRLIQAHRQDEQVVFRLGVNALEK